MRDLFTDLSIRSNTAGGTVMNRYDIMIVGIGGQGTILASNILGVACVIEGLPVRGAETHGMAQRGGSVESQIRIGQEYGPLIAAGAADLLISFDLIETVRALHYLKDKGIIVSNRAFVVPTSVYMQDFPPPDEGMLLAALPDSGLYALDAASIAEEAGNILTQNIVLLGAASAFIPLKEESLKEAIKRIVPKKTIDVNLLAFDLGRTITQ